MCEQEHFSIFTLSTMYRHAYPRLDENSSFCEGKKINTIPEQVPIHLRMKLE